MKLQVKNVGKVSSAEIDVNGITVVAGLNSTGKSTVSRSLFSMFNSFYAISKKVNEEKQRSILKLITENDSFIEDFILSDAVQIQAEELATMLVNKVDTEKIIGIFKTCNISSSFYSNILDEIVKTNGISDDKIIHEIVQDVFRGEFNRFITNFVRGGYSRVDLTIKNQKLSVVFDENNELVSIEGAYSLEHEIVYIDDPFIIDSYNHTSRSPFWGIPEKSWEVNHRKSIISQYNKNENQTVISRAQLREKLSLVYKNINETLGSEINLFNTEPTADAIIVGSKPPLDNLSSGMKTFYLIKKLIDVGVIAQNGTLILDEPEVHLHPEWQIKLAEIIVLLQKELGLHVLINTHSPYFLRAIEVYTKKYGSSTETKFYLSYNEDSQSKFKDVSEKVSEIYKVLSNSLQTLENERYDY